MNSILEKTPGRDLTRIVTPYRKILVVDQEDSTRRLLHRVLEAGKYSISWSQDGTDALNQAVATRPDVIVLELDLPGGGGFQVLRVLSKWRMSRVIVLSWRTGIAEKVRALDAGAYDYMIKPFDPDELAARIRAILRCESPPGRAPPPASGSLEINMATCEMSLNGEFLELTEKERAVLFILARHAGKLVAQKRLIRAIWGDSAPWKSRDLKIQINTLRTKLAKHAEGDLIQGGAWFGYRLDLDVFNIERSASTPGPAQSTSKLLSQGCTPSSVDRSAIEPGKKSELIQEFTAFRL